MGREIKINKTYGTQKYFEFGTSREKSIGLSVCKKGTEYQKLRWKKMMGKVPKSSELLEFRRIFYKIIIRYNLWCNQLVNSLRVRWVQASCLLIE